MTISTEERRRLVGYLADPAVAWSLGSFGVIAEFMRSTDEQCRTATTSCVTGRGAIAIDLPAEAHRVAYTTPSRHEARRRPEIAICLPHAEAAMARRTAITEIGPDETALRAEDRSKVLFDVGLGRYQVDAMVRSADPDMLALLRDATGRPLFECPTVLEALPRLGAHRVFATRCGRIEVYGPIPPPDGLSPDGPHTHVLPDLMRHGRTHAANLPIPHGLVPCLTLHLSRPAADHALRSDAEGDEA